MLTIAQQTVASKASFAILTASIIAEKVVSIPALTVYLYQPIWRFNLRANGTIL